MVHVSRVHNGHGGRAHAFEANRRIFSGSLAKKFQMMAEGIIGVDCVELMWKATKIKR
jgi:hypothetical protein